MCRRSLLLATVLALVTLAAPAAAFRLAQPGAAVANNPADRLAGLTPDPETYDPDPVEPPAGGSVLICCARPRADLVLDL